MKAIILDYGGVLCLHPSDQKVDALAALCGVDRESFLSAYWANRIDYDRGDFSPEGYWLRFAQAVGRQYTPEQVAEFRRRDIDFWLTLDDRMMTWLRRIRAAGIPLGLISNLPMDLGNHLRDHTDLFSHFDYVTLSWEQRSVKPDAPIYQECCAGLGVEPGEAFFLDDREANVAGARNAGLKSIVFVNPDLLAADLQATARELVPAGTPLP